MLSVFVSGGWVMWPLTLCSIFGLAICLEKLISLTKEKVAPPAFAKQVYDWLNSGKSPKLESIAQHSPLGEVLASGLAVESKGIKAIEDAIREQTAKVQNKMEKFLDLLGVIASAAPMLGLLGTVLGMIRIFSAVMSGGLGHAETLAGGIGEALVTTAAGLVVGVPALGAYRLLQRHIENLTLALHSAVGVFLRLRYNSEGGIINGERI